jgi:hypothetical protein
MPGGTLEFFQVYITMVLATLAGMMLGLFASALAPNSSSAPLLVIILILPQIVLGGALIPIPPSVSAPTSSRWAFEALMSITGPGSDVAADSCWALPEDVRASMTIDQKVENNCKCMGPNMLKQESCNHPGLGQFYIPAIDGPAPVEPAPLGDPPPDPVIPERPVQPADQSDTVAMAEFFTAIQEWEQEATAIQEDYKQKIGDFQVRAEVYQAEKVAYETARVELQIAVAPAEGIVKTFHDGVGWAYVDKEDGAAYFAKITKAWLVQSLICLVLLGAILFLQKRKDVT